MRSIEAADMRIGLCHTRTRPPLFDIGTSKSVGLSKRTVALGGAVCATKDAMLTWFFKIQTSQE